MPQYRLKIVGDVFRPPAKAILAVIPAGTPLQLVAEPSNQHDENAVKVMIQSSDIPHTVSEAFEEVGAKYGYSFEELMQKSEWQLGYIPRTDAATLAGKFDPQTPVTGALASMLDGKPAVLFNLGD